MRSWRGAELAIVTSQIVQYADSQITQYSIVRPPFLHITRWMAKASATPRDLARFDRHQVHGYWTI